MRPSSDVEAACDEIERAPLVCVDCGAVLHQGEPGVEPLKAICLPCAAAEAQKRLETKEAAEHP